MITTTDRKIIQLLLHNGRASYSEIAQELAITPSTVAKRIKFLLDSGTIVVRGVLNPHKLGLVAGAVIALKIEPAKEKRICKFLNNELFTSTVLCTIGEFDILCILHTPSWEALNTFITEKLAHIEGVKDYDCRVQKEVVKRFQLFGDNKKFESPPELKEADWEIIRQLCLDGRQSNSEIAEKLGLHVSTVSRRIQFLSSQDYLRILPQPDPAKFHYASSAIVTADLSRQHAQNVCEIISRYEEVALVITTSTKPQIIFGVHTSNNERTANLIQQFLSLPGIEKKEILFRSKVIKTNYWWHGGDLYP